MVIPDGSDSYKNLTYDEDGFGVYEGKTFYQPATQGADGVYQIANAGQLYWFAQSGGSSASAVLTADITIQTGVLNADGELNGTPQYLWTPIGSYTGTFDGQGHTISGLYVDVSGSGDSDIYVYAGLFGYINGGVVKDLSITDSYISGSASSNTLASAYVGGVCGKNNDGTIENCSVSATVTGSVTGSASDKYAYVGGVCGYNNGGTIENCYNSGSVTGSVTGNASDKYANVGGVCGYNIGGTIMNCYNSGSVTGSASGKYAYVGGVCGQNYSYDSYDDGTATITNCYNTGSVTGTGNAYFYVGGVCGYNYAYGSSTAKITNCYSTGTVTSSDGTAYVGGVCGQNFANRGTAKITNCYSTGEVTSTGTYGGVCGTNDFSSGTATITNCYWLTGTASTGIGTGNGTATNVESKTVDEFASGEVAWLLNTYETGSVWAVGDNGYPVLRPDQVNKVVKLTVDNIAR